MSHVVGSEQCHQSLIDHATYQGFDSVDSVRSVHRPFRCSQPLPSSKSPLSRHARATTMIIVDKPKTAACAITSLLFRSSHYD